jgi:hypothetical protein
VLRRTVSPLRFLLTFSPKGHELCRDGAAVVEYGLLRDLPTLPEYPGDASVIPQGVTSMLPPPAECGSMVVKQLEAKERECVNT